MDFQSLKRRDLQSLCKLNNIPANTTNTAMADSLASLPTVEGLEDFLSQGSPERSVNASPNAPRTTATRTRCGTRTRAVEGTDTRKTPATRTNRKRATQEASNQKMMEKDLQTEFEADMEQSGVTESNMLPGCELKEISEVSVENEEQLLLESQSEPQNEVQQEVKDGQEVTDLDDCNQHQEQDEATKMSNDSMKVDFHSLSRKDLQNLCKKNKIPANTTNAAMAGALESLEIVEGLQEFMKECESRAPSSPLMSGITSSCARRSRTTMKITREEPRSSKMITKSCRGSRRRIVEETEQGKNDVPETPAAQAASALCETDSIQKKEDSAVQLENSSEASGVAEFNGDISNCLTQEATVNESTLEDGSEEGNNGLFNVENLEEPRELVSKIGENIVEELSLESLEVTNVLADFVKIDIGSEAVANSATHDKGLKFGSAESESQDGQIENLVSAPDSAAESLLEKLDIVHAEDQMSKEFVSESATQTGQVSFEINEDSKSGNTKLEKVVTFNFDSAAHVSPVELECSYAEDSSDKFDTELTTQADKPSLEINVEGEGSCTEDEMSEMSDGPDEVMSELTIQDDQLSLETNLDSESEDSQAADLFANQFDTESTIQVRSSVPTESKTPLKHKSLRKLRRIYKEKLQQEKTLAKRMEKLSLDETEIALANVEENLQEGNEDDVEESEEDTDDETESDIDSVEQDDVLQETLVTNPDVKTAKLCPVEILVDNEVVPEDAVVGDINVVTCPPQATPSKCSSMTKKPLLFTPTKSSCKTPMSGGRKNRVLDVNKENIDNSISKTEPGKIRLAVTESGKLISAMSLGKLMKEVKVLEQSERKRQALQSRSDNHCNLASS